MTRSLSFAVIGAGNGGYATAAELALLDQEVVLIDLPRFEDRLAPVRSAGGIEVESRAENFARGCGTWLAKLPVTTEMSAIARADVVVIVVPGQHHELFVQATLPHLRAGQLLMLNPGGVGGALVWRAALRSADIGDVLIAQPSDLLYAGSRVPGLPKVVIGGKKAKAALGVFPNRDREQVMALIGEVYPEYELALNALEAGMAGPGMLLHPLPMLMNAVRIDREGAFTYDAYDITQSVANAVEALDRERLAVITALGGRAVPIKDVLTDFYGVTGATFHETVLKVPGYQRIKAPPDFHHRYITEEVPTHMVPTIAVGRQLGVPTPLMQATVTLSSAVAGTDFQNTGWTARRLGIDDLDRSGLLRLLENG